MSTIASHLSASDRQRLLGRLAELAELDALLREPGQQRPPETMPARASSGATQGKD